MLATTRAGAPLRTFFLPVQHLMLLLPLLLLLLLAPPLLSLSGTSAEARQMVSVARPEVNMRAGPGTRHQALWSLTNGYPLEVVGRKGSWYKVRDFENDLGWVYRSLTSTKPYHIVKARVANVRSAPGTRSRVIGKAAYGDVVRTLEKSQGWVKIRLEGGLIGWMSRKLLWGW
jgi:SH3-like domain-containing protein